MPTDKHTDKEVEGNENEEELDLVKDLSSEMPSPSSEMPSDKSSASIVGVAVGRCSIIHRWRSPRPMEQHPLSEMRSADAAASIA